MMKFFASLYEWFGLTPFFSTDMGDYLRGWDITCTDYIGTPWYLYIGLIMIILTALLYAIQYHIIDSPRWKEKQHWWIMALIVFGLNFLIAFLIPYNAVKASDYCVHLHLTFGDCFGFGLSNAIWSFILFLIITTVPVFRKLSINCSFTTFWKP